MNPREFVSYKAVPYTTFTGQRVDENEKVVCPVCEKKISVRIAYIDPYAGKSKNKEMYVHYECLSAKRKQEITENKR